MSMAEPDATARMSRLAVSSPFDLASDSVRTRAAMLALTVLAAVLLVVAVQSYASIAVSLRAGGSTYVENVFPFWAWSRFTHSGTAASRIYDFPVLSAFQHHLNAGYGQRLPFAYPPSLLLVIWPLSWVPPVAAYAIFLGGTLAAYLGACWYRGRGWVIAAAMLVAPSTPTAIQNAQNSLLIAALMYGGCRLVGRRPILSGVLFGLMSIKPQFGLLIPVALISAREWRTFTAAAVTVLASVITSGAVFGWATWAALPAALVHLAHFVAPVAQDNEMSPTVAATLRLLGATPTVTHIGQLTSALLTAGATFACFRHGFRWLSIAALMVGAFLTTPYAFVYDLPIVTCAVLAVCIDAFETGVPLHLWEIVVLVLALLLPYLMIGTSMLGLPSGDIVVVLLFSLIVRRVLAADHRPARAPAPHLEVVLGR